MSKTEKSILTRKHLKQSLLKVMEDQPFNAITVNAIVKEAKVNRSTFYRYFDDKYELIEEIENEFIEDVETRFEERPNLENISESQLYEGILNTLTIFSSQTLLLRTLLGENGDPSFSYKLKESIMQNLPPNNKQSEYPEKYTELAAEVKSSTLINFVAKFDYYSDRFTLQEIARFLTVFFKSW